MTRFQWRFEAFECWTGGHTQVYDLTQAFRLSQNVPSMAHRLSCINNDRVRVIPNQFIPLTVSVWKYLSWKRFWVNLHLHFSYFRINESQLRQKWLSTYVHSEVWYLSSHKFTISMMFARLFIVIQDIGHLFFEFRLKFGAIPFLLNSPKTFDTKQVTRLKSFKIFGNF